MKRIFKKAIGIILAALMVLSALPQGLSVYAADEEDPNIDISAYPQAADHLYMVSVSTDKIVRVDADGSLKAMDDSTLLESGIAGLTDDMFFDTADSTDSRFIDYVALTSVSKKTNVSARPVLTANGGNSTTGWEVMRFEAQPDGTYAIFSTNGDKYVTVDETNGNALTVAAAEITDSEKFIVVLPENWSKAPEKATEIQAERGMNDITLSWKVPAKFLDGFKIFRSNSENGEFDEIATIDGAEGTYKDTGLEKDTYYYYKIKTLAGELESDFSEVIAVKTFASEPPVQVSGVSISESNGHALLTWEEQPNAATYDIYRADGKYSTFEKLDECAGNTYTDTKSGTKYGYYKIVAKNEDSEAEASEIISLEEELFGDSVYIFSPSDDKEKINEIVGNIAAEQMEDEFSENRYAIMFKEGQYDINQVRVGFYTQVLGLGATPYDTVIPDLHVPSRANGDSLTNFWRGAENLSVDKKDPNSEVKWAASQAAALRRMYVNGKLHFDDIGKEASGGFLADSVVTGQTGSWSQQQFFLRNDELIGGWYDGVWNIVFAGTEGAPANTSNWAATGYAGYTTIDEIPVIREKPFIYMSDEGEYEVFVPGLRENSSGVSWSQNSMGDGQSIPISEFYVAKPEDDTAATINAALAEEKHLLFTPGIYHLEDTINVENPNTVILGIGFPTLIPDNGQTAMQVSDEEGITVAGLLFDAGEKESPVLLQVGEAGNHSDNSLNPILLSDVIVRVGGAHPGKAAVGVEVNSDYTIGDHFWLWRADHGANVGWNDNTAKNGLIVNGDNVSIYGLFVEHFQEYQTLWNGDNGRMYFYQSELPYDPPHQEDWMSHNGETEGYSSYKVSEEAQGHKAYGLGIYEVFIHTDGFVNLENAMEVSEGTEVTHACIVSLGHNGRISHVVNGEGSFVDATMGMTGQKVGIDSYTAPSEEKPQTDKTRLRTLYNENHARFAENYTEDTFAAFSEALAEAKAVLDDENAVQTEIDQCADELEKAVKGLVLSEAALNGDTKTAKKGVSSWYYAGSDASRHDVSVLEKAGVSWFYNWGFTPECAEETDTMEYVPMIWSGQGVTDDTIEKLKEGKEEGLYKNLLTFNEPDLDSQADMTVDEAIELWPQLMETGLRLGSPAPAAVDSAWLEQFMGQIEEKGYYVDFINLHVYQDFTHPDSVQSLKDTILNLYDKYGVPIWITEIGAIDVSSLWQGYTLYDQPSIELAQKYIEEVTAMLESLDCVERYAWFVDSSSDLNGTQYTRLFDTDTDELTAVGETYAGVEGDTQVSWISLSENEKVMVQGETDTLYSWINPILPQPETEWYSTDENIVKVENGKLTAIKEGVARVGLRTLDGKFEDVCTIKVKEPLDPTGWEAKAISNRENDGQVEANVLDKNIDSVWMTAVGREAGDWFQVDMKQDTTISEILIDAGVYDGNKLTDYKLEVSENGTEWTTVKEGVLTSAKELIALDEPVTTRYFRLVAGSKHEGWYSWVIAELSVFGEETLTDPLRLYDQYQSCIALDESAFTESSWNKLSTDLVQAAEMLDDPQQYSQEEIDQMTALLKEDVSNLVYKVYGQEFSNEEDGMQVKADSENLVKYEEGFAWADISDTEEGTAVKDKYTGDETSELLVYELMIQGKDSALTEKILEDGQKLTVTMKLPAGFEKVPGAVYFVSPENGNLQILDMTWDKESGTVTFMMPGLGCYAVAVSEETQAPGPDQGQDGENPGSDQDQDSEKPGEDGEKDQINGGSGAVPTGDGKTSMPLVLIVLASAGICGGILYTKKKKY